MDVKIKRVNYVEQVRKSVYNRMIAERKQIAEKFRSEGRGEASKILGEKERELKLIESQAYRTAQEIKGKAEAKAIKLYADAYGKDPEFYSFTKSLDVYQRALGDKTALVLGSVKGIGKALSEKLTELVTTGRLAYYGTEAIIFPLRRCGEIDRGEVDR